MSDVNVGLFIEQSLRIYNLIKEREKKPRTYGTDSLLYSSEIHTIDVIGRKRGINVTELAASLGVTKGAVTQMIDKLIKKGFVTRTRLAENVVELNLTGRGDEAFKKHEEYHHEMYKHIYMHLSGLPEDTVNAFTDILDTVEAFLSTNE